MKGKVRNIRREKFEVVAQSSMASHYEHGVRGTSTNAVLYPENDSRPREVCLDEDDIRNYYGQSRITEKLLSRLNDDLHNKHINYEKNEEGDYVIVGRLSDYIQN